MAGRDGRMDLGALGWISVHGMDLASRSTRALSRYRRRSPCSTRARRSPAFAGSPLRPGSGTRSGRRSPPRSRARACTAEELRARRGPASRTRMPSSGWTGALRRSRPRPSSGGGRAALVPAAGPLRPARIAERAAAPSSRFSRRRAVVAWRRADGAALSRLPLSLPREVEAPSEQPEGARGRRIHLHSTRSSAAPRSPRSGEMTLRERADLAKSPVEARHGPAGPSETAGGDDLHSLAPVRRRPCVCGISTALVTAPPRRSRPGAGAGRSGTASGAVNLVWIGVGGPPASSWESSCVARGRGRRPWRADHLRPGLRDRASAVHRGTPARP